MEGMFCFQCEQTRGGVGCSFGGMCGKDVPTAALQDLLVHAAKGLATVAHRARKLGIVDRDADAALVRALFSTVTNVNFDPERLIEIVRATLARRDALQARYAVARVEQGQQAESLLGAAALVLAADFDGMIAQGQQANIVHRIFGVGRDVTGLQELLVYGLKGAAAYAEHARILGYESDEVYAFFHEALDFLAGNPTSADALLDYCMKCGAINLQVMELLDKANTTTYGHPVPTPLRIEPLAGKAILVSGHDLKDLEALLEQTEGKGINVYTHGEMLPAHGYPGLKKFKHLAGNYGSAWQNQVVEFATFPGAILMTTNCIQEPHESYGSRIFTSGLVAFPGVRHIADRNFAPVIEAALAAPGFDKDGSDKTILTGFGHNAVLGVADKIVGAVKAGKIRHFFLVGGCDGARPGRDYYTEFARSVPDDCVVLTLACGKYRFNKLEFGDIDGIPRLLDVGQCNDAFSAIRIASALADAFGTDVNGLPLSLILSWYEQKAVAILLTLLHLGIRNIRLGPTLPAFVTPPVLDVLVQKFGIMPIGTPQADLEAILA